MSKKQSKSNETTLVVKLFSGNTEVESLKDATHILIATCDDAPVIEIGNRDRSHSRPALTFAQDQFKFGRYTHPMTDFEQDIHVLSTADVSRDAQGRFTNPHQEDVAVVGPNSPFETAGQWWSADLVKQGNALVLQPNHPLDPVDHSDEIALRMHKRNATQERIDDAVDREQDRAYGDAARIAKHSWGQYASKDPKKCYGFKVYVAHIRPYAERILATLTEPDLAKAYAMRNAKIHDKVVRSRYVKGSDRRVPDSLGTDKPDFVDAADAAEKPKAIVGLSFPFVKNGKLTGTTTEIGTLPIGTMISLWLIEGRGLVDGRWHRQWDPENEAMVDTLTGWAKPTSGGKPRYGIEHVEIAQ